MTCSVLRSCLWGPIAILLLSGRIAAAAEGSRPNILFCIADDWGYPHAGAYGDPVVRTPAFDRVAREGVLFTHAFSAAPSCTPSRAAILTGQAPHRLAEGGNLYGFLPARWPAGDPEFYFSVGPFGDCDGSPTKDWILDRRAETGMARFFRLCFDKRPGEELYDLSRDDHQMTNVAGQAAYADARQHLRAELDRWMKETGDPRADSDDDRWDRYPYLGGRTQPRPAPRP